MESKTVLVVDDDPVLRDLVAFNLRREGYECRTAAGAQEAISAVRRHEPSVILLDLLMPGITGLEVCRMIRRESDVPILILTARDEEFDKVLALEIGADDYMTKPFSMRELLARVKALLRRSEKSSPLATADPMIRLVRGNLEIVPAKHEVRVEGRIVTMTAKEYLLLQLLASHPGVVFTRDTLLERVWQFEYPGATTRTVDVHVNSVRKKVETDPSNPRYVLTVRGVGYRFAE
ncbi:MAG: response regulator [Chloroflexota bacterium]